MTGFFSLMPFFALHVSRCCCLLAVHVSFLTVFFFRLFRIPDFESLSIVLRLSLFLPTSSKSQTHGDDDGNRKCVRRREKALFLMFGYVSN